MPTRAGPATEVDGRTARRDRNRLAVLDAVLDLFAEGDSEPAPEQVARRSGVSLRSVYRYFADQDELLRSAIARHLEHVEPLFEIEGRGAGSLDARIARLVQARLRGYDAIAATWRASCRRAPTSPIIRNQMELGRRRLRAQVDRHFAPELRALPATGRKAIAAALDALTQIETIELYRNHRGFSSRETARLLSGALGALLHRPEEDA